MADPVYVEDTIATPKPQTYVEDTVGGTTSRPTNPKPPANQWAAFAQNTRQGVVPHIKQAATAALKGLNVPVSAANAVLGAPERYVSGLIGAHQGGQHGFVGDVGSGLWGAFHPNSQATLDTQGEHALGLDKLADMVGKGMHGDVPMEIPIQGTMVPVMVNIDTVRKIGLDTLYENITDPVNLLFGAGAIRRTAAKAGEGLIGKGLSALATGLEAPGRAGAKAYEAIPRVTEGAVNKLGSGMAKVVNTVSPGRMDPERMGRSGTQLLNLVRSSPYARRSLTTSASRGVEASENYADDVLHRLEADRDRILREHGDELTKYDEQLAEYKAQKVARDAGEIGTDVPEPVRPHVPQVARQLANRFAYLEGTPAVRKAAIAAGYVPTEEEKLLPTTDILPTFKDEYAPQTIGFDATEGLVPEGEQVGRTRIKTGQPGFTKRQYAEEPDTPLVDRLKTRTDAGLAQLGGVQRLLHKQIALKGMANIGLEGMAAFNPDIERTQNILSRLKMHGAPASQIAKVERLLVRQHDAAAASRAALITKVRHGEEIVPLGETLGQTIPEHDTYAGEAGKFITQKQLRKQLEPRALRNLGMTPGKMSALEGAPKSVPFTASSKPKTTQSLQSFLKGRESTRYYRDMQVAMANRVATRVAEGMQKLVDAEHQGAQGAQGAAEQVAQAGQRGITRGETIAGQAHPVMEDLPPGSVSRRAQGVAKRQETQLGKMQANVAKTATQTSEAATKYADLRKAATARKIMQLQRVQKVVDKLAASATGAQATMLKRDASLLSEIVGREQFNQGLQLFNDELDRQVNRYLNQVVPKGYIAHAFQPTYHEPDITFLTGMSTLSKEAMYFNPLVHGFKNIGVRQALGPAGVAGIIRATAFGLGAAPDARAAAEEELRSVGALAHYVTPEQEAGESVGAKISRAAKGTTQALDTDERIALWQTLKHSDELDPFTGKAYKDLPPIERGAVVNEVLGEYAHQSNLSKWLRRIGVPFPHWRLSLIAMMTRAMLTQPQRVNMAIRGMQGFDRDVFAKDPYDLGFYTPIDTGLEGMDPATWGQFTQGMLGPLSILFGNDTTTQRLEKALNIMTLGVSGAAGIDPYKSSKTQNVPWWERAGAGEFGSYFRPKPKP